MILFLFPTFQDLSWNDLIINLGEEGEEHYDILTETERCSLSINFLAKRIQLKSLDFSLMLKIFISLASPPLNMLVVPPDNPLISISRSYLCR